VELQEGAVSVPKIEHVSPVSVRWGGRTFPRIDSERIGDVEWKLRYGAPTISERSIAAEVMAAYRALVLKTAAERAEIVRVLKHVAGASPTPSPERGEG
jgi:hypothetical protein